MRVNNTFLLFLAGIFFSAGARAEGMCNVNEVAIFNCELKKNTASLCKSKDRDVVTYRNGNRKMIKLVLSDNGEGNVFFFSNVPYAGGGESHVRFSINNYSYYLYDKTVKTDSGPIFSAGIVVYRRADKISNLLCNNNASIRQYAYQNLARDNYRNIDAK